MVAQEGVGLGERLQRSFALAFDRGARRVVVCGSDVPDLTSRALQYSLQALTSSDAVLGPALDGGFYLLGLARSPPASLFADVPWSTSAVLATMQCRAAEAGLRVAPLSLLPSLCDIDTVEDLLAWRARTPEAASVLAFAADAALAGWPPHC